MSQQVPRKTPEIVITPSGSISWKPIISDHDSNLFDRGKTVSNREFNDLFVKQVYQSNYISDTLAEFFERHMHTVVGRTFENDYNLVHSYIHVITSENDWGERQEDGYYYITIPASTHGFQPVQDSSEEGINIDTELYLCNPDTGEYFEVLQITTENDNTVRLYTDDPRATGIAVIRSNERSYALSGTHLTTAQIRDIADVAKTNDYNSLFNLPDLTGITTNANTIQNILNGTYTIQNASYAKYVTDYIGTRPINEIFETGSTVVKQATNAKNFIEGGNIQANFIDTREYIDTQYNNLSQSFEQSITNIVTGTTKVGDAARVNDLEITRDADGVLRIGDTIIPQKRLLNGNEYSTNLQGSNWAGTTLDVPLNIDCSNPVKIKIILAIEMVTLRFSVDDEYIVLYSREVPYETTVYNHYLSDSHFVTFYKRMDPIGSLGTELDEINYATFTLACNNNTLSFSQLGVSKDTDFTQGADYFRNLRVMKVYQIIE